MHKKTRENGKKQHISVVNSRKTRGVIFYAKSILRKISSINNTR